jgi:glucokinase-like ROK family protein
VTSGVVAMGGGESIVPAHAATASIVASIAALAVRSAPGLADSIIRPWSRKCPIPSVRDAKLGRYHRVVSEGPAELVRAPVIGPHQPLPDEVLDALVTVLDEVRLGRSRSRSELVERTGLGRAIVARRVQELIDRGLLSEGDVGPSTGGRPPRHLAFCADAGHVLVADLGATSIDVAVTGLDGRILGHHDEPARIEDGPERALERVDALFDSLLRTTQDIPGRLWGIGIGVPGPVEFDSGRPISPPIMPGWDGYPIRERFTQRYRAPVWVDNDVNLLALGEWRSGVASGHDNVVVVKIGTGIGAGIISDGRLHRGAQGSAGDVGHIQVTDDPAVLCRCGNVGCLEALAGGAALGRAGEAAALDGRSARLQAAFDLHGSLSAEDVARAASFGDPVAVAQLQAAGRLVGSMLAGIVNFFNPSLIVIGGGVANSPDQLMAAIRGTIYRRSLPLATRDLSIQRSSLGALAGVIGASSMVVDQLFARGAIARWIEAGDPASMPDLPLARAG